MALRRDLSSTVVVLRMAVQAEDYYYVLSSSKVDPRFYGDTMKKAMILAMRPGWQLESESNGFLIYKIEVPFNGNIQESWNWATELPDVNLEVAALVMPKS